MRRSKRDRTVELPLDDPEVEVYAVPIHEEEKEVEEIPVIRQQPLEKPVEK